MKKSLPLRKEGETAATGAAWDRVACGGGMVTLTVFCLRPGQSAPQGEEVTCSSL